MPLVDPAATVATTCVSLQLMTTPLMLPSHTVPLPWVEPKPVPVIVTEVPGIPEVGETLVMLGGTSTVKLTPLLAAAPTVTTTFPVVAALGTGTAIEVELQLVGVATVPLNVTELLLCEAPKLVPVSVIDVPTAPEVGDRLVRVGGGMIVNGFPLLNTPF